MPTVALHTLGCKLNHAETATIGQQFVERGFRVAEEGEPVDVFVINTCSVTERADRECRQVIRRAMRAGKRPYVIVTGCYAQLDPETVASIDGVDLVLGSREKLHLFEHADFRRKGRSPRVAVSALSGEEAFGPAYSSTVSGRTRAYLKVQDGCDYQCSFCTIPRARGGSRSQALHTTVEQARTLVGQGYREIVLTGVNVGDYGRKDRTSLLELARALCDVSGLERLRISSIEPNLLTPELLEFVARSRQMCRHFHIPLQSGCDATLRAMRRRYTAGQYAALIDAVRTRIPECGIGADVIVGFPGETDRQFEATHRFLTDLPVSYLHVFTYSERAKTQAASLAGTVDPAVRSRRSEMLRMLGQKKRRAFYESMVGRRCSVLAESEVEGPFRYGFTDNYVRVALPAGLVGENSVVAVAIEGVNDRACIGVPAERKDVA